MHLYTVVSSSLKRGGKKSYAHNFFFFLEGNYNNATNLTTQTLSPLHPKHFAMHIILKRSNFYGFWIVIKQSMLCYPPCLPWISSHDTKLCCQGPITSLSRSAIFLSHWPWPSTSFFRLCAK